MGYFEKFELHSEIIRNAAGSSRFAGFASLQRSCGRLCRIFCTRVVPIDIGTKTNLQIRTTACILLHLKSKQPTHPKYCGGDPTPPAFGAPSVKSAGGWRRYLLVYGSLLLAVATFFINSILLSNFIFYLDLPSKTVVGAG